MDLDRDPTRELETLSRSPLTIALPRSCGLKNVFRAIPAYMDAAARANMNEFHPSDQIDAALSVEGESLDVVA